jgi:hypothetical protein
VLLPDFGGKFHGNAKRLPEFDKKFFDAFCGITVVFGVG